MGYKDVSIPFEKWGTFKLLNFNLWNINEMVYLPDT